MKKIYTSAVALMTLLLPVLSLAQEACTPHVQESNNFENGLFIESSGPQHIANDFSISSNTETFSASSVTANILSIGGIMSMDIYFYSDDDGMPGTLMGTALMEIVPTSQEIIGTAFGYDVQEVVLDFPEPIDFAGGNKYWIELSATPNASGSQVAWEVTTASTIGLPLAFNNQNTETWTFEGVDDGVFVLSGECTYIEGCLFPEELSAENITTSSADINWTEVGSATEWNIEYGPTGFTPGEGAFISDNDGAGISLSDLESLTSYDVYVQSICGEDDASGWVGPFTFTTNDSYCAGTTIFDVEPITYVEFNDLINASPEDATIMHEYFLDMSANLTTEMTFTIILEGYTGGDFENTFSVFIDWNQDHEFDPESERYDIGTITNSTGIDGQQVQGEITVPADALDGTTRMRIVKMYTSSEEFPADACTAVSYGQFEDYSVIVTYNVGIDDFSKYDFTFGPNPSNDYVQFNSTDVISNVTIFNLLGQKVASEMPASTTPVIDISALAAGTYLMKVSIAAESKVFKIVKN